ncbi:MAG: hypothetical protein ACI9FW_001712, partial [Flavobacterium sp.]
NVIKNRKTIESKVRIFAFYLCKIKKYFCN